MQLKTLEIASFKNYEQAKLRFKNRVICFTGYNGAGKTNLLDAIYCLCTGKSYFNPIDQQLIRHEENYFSLHGVFINEMNEEDDIRCALVKGRKKVIKRNEEVYARLAEHYGEFPAVMVAPGDMELIGGGSEERRKWLDSTISLIDRDYLLKLIQYDKALQQRNAALKRLSQEGSNETQLLDVYNEMLSPLANHIYERRKHFITDFMPFFNEYHQYISQEHEQVSLAYISTLHEGPLLPQLQASLRKDLILQRTNKGTHRDELDFLIAGQPLKRFGSQGQQKTYLLALKLAQQQYIRQLTNKTPVLLLDDVCERLDDTRLTILFDLISQENFGQVFITDSSAERIKKYMDKTGTDFDLFIVDNGRINVQ